MATKSPSPALLAANRLLKTTRRTTNALSIRQYSAPSEDTIPAAKRKYVPTSGSYPKGFQVSATYVGVKATNKSRPDLALFASDTPANASAVFTRNIFQAAPVQHSRKLLHANKGKGFRGIIVNSGCANAVTGAGGLEDAKAMGEAASNYFGSPENSADANTFVMSTGVIGQRLPIQKILDKVPEAYEGLGSTHEHWLAAAQAICTTDTFPKLISRSFNLPSQPGVEFRIAGMTKGAGMIHPNMATLLGMIFTDATVPAPFLRHSLKEAVDSSFNSITIDGDTSTNDTVSIMANGAAGGPLLKGGTPDSDAFKKVLTELTQDLAKLVVRDGEGATKFVTIRVTGALTDGVARRAATTIAKSPLVKTALYGKDANWGRILCAVGYSTISPQTTNFRSTVINPESTSVSFIPSDGSPELKLLVNGEPETVDEKRAAEVLELEDVEILVDLGNGEKSVTYWTCDYSHEYITINGDYRT